MDKACEIQKTSVDQGWLKSAKLGRIRPMFAEVGENIVEFGPTWRPIRTRHVATDTTTLLTSVRTSKHGARRGGCVPFRLSHAAAAAGVGNARAQAGPWANTWSCRMGSGRAAPWRKWGSAPRRKTTNREGRESERLHGATRSSDVRACGAIFGVATVPRKRG